MLKLTLYTTSNCSLCDSLKADLLALQPKIGFVLEEQNIDGEVAEKLVRYRNLVPVLDIENGAVLYSPFSYDELFDAIDAAMAALSEIGTSETGKNA